MCGKSEISRYFGCVGCFSVWVDHIVYKFLYLILQRNQIGRDQPDDLDIFATWNEKMVPIENLGCHFGRRVTWIGASSDNTFVRLEASLISPSLLRRSTVTANKSAIGEQAGSSYFQILRL